MLLSDQSSCADNGDFSVDREALRAGEVRPRAAPARRPRRSRWSTIELAPPEGAGPERAAETSRPAGRQDVVGAGGVVAERRGAAVRRRRRTRQRGPGDVLVRPGERELEVLGRDRRRRAASAASSPGAETRCEARLADARAARPRCPRPPRQSRPAARRPVRRATSGPSSPCSAWAQRSRAIQRSASRRRRQPPRAARWARPGRRSRRGRETWRLASLTKRLPGPR